MDAHHQHTYCTTNPHHDGTADCLDHQVTFFVDDGLTVCHLCNTRKASVMDPNLPVGHPRRQAICGTCAHPSNLPAPLKAVS